MFSFDYDVIFQLNHADVTLGDGRRGFLCRVTSVSGSRLRHPRTLQVRPWHNASGQPSLSLLERSQDGRHALLRTAVNLALRLRTSLKHAF